MEESDKDVSYSVESAESLWKMISESTAHLTVSKTKVVEFLKTPKNVSLHLTNRIVEQVLALKYLGSSINKKKE